MRIAPQHQEKISSIIKPFTKNRKKKCNTNTTDEDFMEIWKKLFEQGFLPPECKNCCQNRSISTCENLRHIVKRYEYPLEDRPKNIQASILNNEPLNLNPNRKSFKNDIGDLNHLQNPAKNSNCAQIQKDEISNFQKDVNQQKESLLSFILPAQIIKDQKDTEIIIKDIIQENLHQIDNINSSTDGEREEYLCQDGDKPCIMIENQTQNKKAINDQNHILSSLKKENTDSEYDSPEEKQKQIARIQIENNFTLCKKSSNQQRIDANQIKIESSFHQIDQENSQPTTPNSIRFHKTGLDTIKQMLSSGGYKSIAHFGSHIEFVEKSKAELFQAHNRYMKARMDLQSNLFMFQQWGQQKMGPEFQIQQLPEQENSSNEHEY